jgi:hypothetical protein
MSKVKATLTGVQAKDHPQNLQTLTEGDKVDLISYIFELAGHEPDDHAVLVTTEDGKELGSIKRGENVKFHGNACTTGVVVKLKRAKGADVTGVDIEVDLVEKVAERPDETPVRLESFNEKGVVLDFYPIAHEYWHNDYGKMENASSYIGEMYKPFDGAGVARNCTRSWGMSVENILKMWAMNGKFSADIGTHFHEYMERSRNGTYITSDTKLFDKTMITLEGFLEMRKTYGEKRGLSKQQFINDITAKGKISITDVKNLIEHVVKSFEWHDIELAGTEVFFTDIENKRCGQVDRLELIDGIYRIGDYKINAGWNKSASQHKNLKYQQLPNKKTTKYQVQCSFYAQMGDNSGMPMANTVVAYIFDGFWHMVELPRIIGVYSDNK